jgi:hypothetical protein
MASTIDQTICNFSRGSFALCRKYFMMGPEGKSGEMRAGESPRSKAIPRKGEMFGWSKLFQIRASSYSDCPRHDLLEQILLESDTDLQYKFVSSFVIQNASAGKFLPQPGRKIQHGVGSSNLVYLRIVKADGSTCQLGAGLIHHGRCQRHSQSRKDRCPIS